MRSDQRSMSPLVYPTTVIWPVVPLDEWTRCPIGKVRPHKEQLFEILEQHRSGSAVPLSEKDIREVEDAGNEG
jgi:hypothetical protein